MHANEWWALFLFILLFIALTDGPIGKNGKPPRGIARKTSVPTYEKKKWVP